MTIDIKQCPASVSWIPCKTRLPDTIDAVLISWRNNATGDHGVGAAHYCAFDGNWYWYSQYSEDVIAEYLQYDDVVEVDVVAWIPMPDEYDSEVK